MARTATSPLKKTPPSPLASSLNRPVISLVMIHDTENKIENRQQIQHGQIVKNEHKTNKLTSYT